MKRGIFGSSLVAASVESYRSCSRLFLNRTFPLDPAGLSHYVLLRVSDPNEAGLLLLPTTSRQPGERTDQPSEGWRREEAAGRACAQLPLSPGHESQADSQMQPRRLPSTNCLDEAPGKLTSGPSSPPLRHPGRLRDFRTGRAPMGDPQLLTQEGHCRFPRLPVRTYRAGVGSRRLWGASRGKRVAGPESFALLPAVGCQARFLSKTFIKAATRRSSH